MTVASEITRLTNAKSCIKSSIENKGVSVPSNLKLDGYYSCINALPTTQYLTKAEYDALPSSKLTNGIAYGIMVSGALSYFIRNGISYEVIPKFRYIVVGGGGAGTYGRYNSGGSGGGGGQVLFGEKIADSLPLSCPITIGRGGCSCCDFARDDGMGCPTCFGNIEAQGGCYGGTCGPDVNACYTDPDRKCGGWSGSGCAGGGFENLEAGGGGGAGGVGGNGIGMSHPGYGGAGICGYGGGGGGGSGGWGIGYGCDGGGNGAKSGNGCSATKYGGGGGGGAYNSRNNTRGGAGCKGVVIICYKSDGSSGISCATGGTVTTSGGYKIHTFTSDGTFCIVC